MTTKEYKKACRIKTTRIAKFITWLSLVLFFCLAEYLGLNGYLTASIGTTLWFYMPDLATHVLENRYRIKHDKVSYR